MFKVNHICFEYSYRDYRPKTTKYVQLCDFRVAPLALRINNISACSREFLVIKYPDTHVGYKF